MPPHIPEHAHRIDLPGYSERVGKVRHTYDIDQKHLLMVASDRVSVFDVVLPTRIPRKGEVLTAISKFWFDFAEKLGIPHHLVTANTEEILDRYPQLEPHQEQLAGRSMLVKKGKVPPVEAIVRGNITGSGWKEYQKTGKVCGIELPANLKQCQELNPPLFTPSTKADEGHDQNISFEEACDVAGRGVMEEIRDRSLLLFTKAREYAKTRGIIIADTKFEFAQTPEGLLLADEVLTSDSSRFWPLNTYEVGHDQPSLDKQFVRNHAEATGWQKVHPGPELPDEVVAETTRKYLQAYEQLTGQHLRA